MTRREWLRTLGTLALAPLGVAAACAPRCQVPINKRGYVVSDLIDTRGNPNTPFTVVLRQLTPGHWDERFRWVEDELVPLAQSVGERP